MSVEWIKYTDQKPDMSDADYSCNLWVSGIGEKSGTRLVGLMPFARAADFFESGAVDYWADTGLCLPLPPLVEGE